MRRELRGQLFVVTDRKYSHSDMTVKNSQRDIKSKLLKR